jgi:hypothetical protein
MSVLDDVIKRHIKPKKEVTDDELVKLIIHSVVEVANGSEVKVTPIMDVAEISSQMEDGLRFLAKSFISRDGLVLKCNACKDSPFHFSAMKKHYTAEHKSLVLSTLKAFLEERESCWHKKN